MPVMSKKGTFKKLRGVCNLGFFFFLTRQGALIFCCLCVYFLYKVHLGLFWEETMKALFFYKHQIILRMLTLFAY